MILVEEECEFAGDGKLLADGVVKSFGDAYVVESYASAYVKTSPPALFLAGINDSNYLTDEEKIAYIRPVFREYFDLEIDWRPNE